VDLALSELVRFDEVNWSSVPDAPGVYVIFDLDEALYVGMAGRNGKGCLRSRLRDHASGQIVNMFAQYLFLARVQFLHAEPITHPREVKQACTSYLRERCAFKYQVADGAAEARELESWLKRELRPALNP
jgi:hypothetical protein